MGVVVTHTCDARTEGDARGAACAQRSCAHGGLCARRWRRRRGRRRGIAAAGGCCAAGAACAAVEGTRGGRGGGGVTHVVWMLPHWTRVRVPRSVGACACASPAHCRIPRAGARAGAAVARRGARGAARGGGGGAVVRTPVRAARVRRSPRWCGARFFGRAWSAAADRVATVSSGQREAGWFLPSCGNQGIRPHCHRFG